MKPQAEALERFIQELVESIVEASRPDAIILFGSAARGTMHEDSDLDLLIVKGGCSTGTETTRCRGTARCRSRPAVARPTRCGQGEDLIVHEGRTRGAPTKSKCFRWYWDGQTLHIHRENRNHQHDEFPRAELEKILEDRLWDPGRAPQRPLTTAVAPQ